MIAIETILIVAGALAIVLAAVAVLVNHATPER